MGPADCSHANSQSSAFCFALGCAILFLAESGQPNSSPMKMILASVFTTILIVAMTLGAMFILVQATEYVTSLKSPLQRAAAMSAARLLAVVLLLGTIWLAPRLA